MRGMSWRRADQPGNRGRPAAGDPDLREVPSRRPRSRGVALLRVPHLPRLEPREGCEGDVHFIGVAAQQLIGSNGHAQFILENFQQPLYFVLITYTPSHSPSGALCENSMARSRNTWLGPSSGYFSRTSVNSAAASRQFCDRYSAMARSNCSSNFSYLDFSAATSSNS